MDVKDILRKNLICFLKNNTKNEAVNELITLLHDNKVINDMQAVKDLFLAREELMSTGIGLGIGIPHIRVDEISSPVIAIGLAKDGIDDYGAIDNQPVKIIFMILVRSEERKEYISLLAQIATVLKDDQFREQLLTEQTVDAVYAKLQSAFAKTK